MMRRRAFLAATAASPVLMTVPGYADTRLIAGGTFRDGDPVHRGSSTLRIVRADGDARRIELRNMQVVEGLNLFVYLVVEPDPLFPEDVTAEFFSLGRLKSLTVDHDYPIPSEVRLEDWGSVVVWCDTFMTASAVATIERP